MRRLHPALVVGRQLLADERLQVAALLLLALLVRLALHFRAPAFVGKDSQSYFLPGWEIARGEPFWLGQRRTPGYPLFVAVSILALGEELRSLALAQHLLGTATVGLTYLLGRLTFGRASGLAAGCLVAVSGPLLLYERYVMSETFFGFTLALVLAAVVWALRRPSGRRWLTLGLALGAAVLARPVAQVLIPLAGLGILAANWRAPRRALLGLAALGVGLALLLGPWVLRNALTTGNAGASTFGRTLIARTAYYDRGFVFEVPAESASDPQLRRATQIVQEGAKRRESDGVIAGRLRQELGLDPVEANRLLREVALSAILRDPGHFLSGTLAFAVEIFQGREERLRDHWDEYRDANPWDPRIRELVGPATAVEQAERANASRLVQLYQPHRVAGLLGGLAAVGLLLAALVPAWRPGLPTGLAVLLLLLASAALNGPVERYRYPLDPAISVLAAGGLFGSLGLLFRAVSSLRGARSGLVQADPEARAAGEPAR